MGERRAGLRRNQLQRRGRACHRRRSAVTEKNLPRRADTPLCFVRRPKGGIARSGEHGFCTRAVPKVDRAPNGQSSCRVHRVKLTRCRAAEWASCDLPFGEAECHQNGQTAATELSPSLREKRRRTEKMRFLCGQNYKYPARMRNFEGTKQFQNKDSHDHKQQLGEYRESLARENPVSHGDGARI